MSIYLHTLAPQNLIKKPVLKQGDSPDDLWILQMFNRQANSRKSKIRNQPFCGTERFECRNLDNRNRFQHKAAGTAQTLQSVEKIERRGYFDRD